MPTVTAEAFAETFARIFVQKLFSSPLVDEIARSFAPSRVETAVRGKAARLGLDVEAERAKARQRTLTPQAGGEPDGLTHSGTIRVSPARNRAKPQPAPERVAALMNATPMGRTWVAASSGSGRNDHA